MNKRHSYRNTAASLRLKTTDINGCWEWNGAKTKDGYGRTTKKSKSTTTHRRMYELVFGEIPRGLHVLHMCDNPPCINPEHLELGDHNKNMAQMQSRGRKAVLSGEDNPSAKLTEEDVSDIKIFLRNGILPKDIIKVYPIKQAIVYHIKNNRVWSNVRGYDDRLEKAGL